MPHTSMFDLDPLDVLELRSVRRVQFDPRGKVVLETSFRPEKGHHFVVLYLGAQRDDVPLTADTVERVLNQHGWYFREESDGNQQG